MGDPRQEVGDDVRRHPVRRDGPKDVEMGHGDEDRPAALAVPGRLQHGVELDPVRLDERGDRLGAHPGHLRRPQEDAGGAADLVDRQLGPAEHLADRPLLGGGGQPVGRLGAGQLPGDGPVRIGREDDDGERAAGPRDIRQAAYAGLALGRLDGALGGRGQDDGGDGHGPAMLAVGIGHGMARKASPSAVSCSICDTARPHA
jgi:hypothetical protein